MKILIILSGSGVIPAAEANLLGFRAGDCLVVPAAYKGAIQFADDTQYLTVTI